MTVVGFAKQGVEGWVVESRVVEVKRCGKL